ICGRRPNSGQRITSTSRNLVPSRSPSTQRWPILPRILIQCGGCLDATVKKAVWNSNKLRRFPKANLIIYSRRGQFRRGPDAALGQRRDHSPRLASVAGVLEPGQALDHQPRPSLCSKKKRRARLVQRALVQPTWAVGFGDEVWWSRLAQPDQHGWTDTEATYKLQE